MFDQQKRIAFPYSPDGLQARALETWHSDSFSKGLQQLHATLGLVGESGELSELLKKDTFKPGHESTRDERLDELGDVLYYLLILAHLDGCTIDELSQRNYEKLKGGHGWQRDNINIELNPSD
jgi:NTP pyrophosphatase (non-canonical NTP hydrolase)